MKTWTTGEVAHERNISVRTLRYYDEIGLLTPTYKDEHGKRMYSEDDLFTLEKIMILKSLSLPLKSIREVIEKMSYEQILKTHYTYLQEQLEELQTNIGYTSSLINMIEFDEELSWEKVVEVVHKTEKSSGKWLDYFENEDQQTLQKSIPSLSHKDAMLEQSMNVLRQMEQCIQDGIPPESDEGIDIARALHKLSSDIFDGNEHLMDQFWKVRKLPAEETGFFPISEEVLDFAERATDYAQKEKG